MRQTKLIRNAKAIISCDEADKVYYDADILIEGSAIKEIGYNLVAEDADVIDGRDKFVYPGLINTHHHFFQSFVRNLSHFGLRDHTMTSWISGIYEIFQVIDLDILYYASLVAMADLIKHGCTTAFDHQYLYTTASGKETIDRQFEAADLLGIRYVAGRGTNTLPMSEGSIVPDPMVETTEEYIRDCERLLDLYHDDSPFSMRQIVLAPCQPINCYPETFTETVALARDRGVRMHTHLGEGENELMLARYGKRSVAWCEGVGFIGPDVWYAHQVELLPEEYDVLGQVNAGISHCSAAAILAGWPILDLPALEDAGVVVSLGCDGSASNDGSSLLDTMRLAYGLQSYHRRSLRRPVFAYDILKMATVNGARTLGRDDLGSLTVGKAADLFMVDTGTLELCGALHDPKNLLPLTGTTGPVWLTMCNGQVIFENGTLTGVDERQLAKEGEAISDSRLRSRFEAYRLSHYDV